jgi:quinol-cytochrome oxidoreductase complex cytochrome b subunit
LLPFVIFGVVGLHVVALHIAGSNNPDGIDVKSEQDTVPFTPYFTAKDSVGLLAFLLIYAVFVFYLPNYMGHADNYIEANPLATPAHIVPEWYFLPFYAMLRAITFEFFWFIPAKLGGVLTMFGSIGVLFIIPWLDTSRVRSCRYRPIYKWFVGIFFADCILLGFCGAAPAEGVWLYLSQAGTAYYFFHFLILLPILGKVETPLLLPISISKPVTGGGGSAAVGAVAAKMEKK